MYTVCVNFSGRFYAIFWFTQRHQKFKTHFLDSEDLRKYLYNRWKFIIDFFRTLSSYIVAYRWECDSISFIYKSPSVCNQVCFRVSGKDFLNAVISYYIKLKPNKQYWHWQTVSGKGSNHMGWGFQYCILETPLNQILASIT